ncbi:hypothetical protein J2X36_005159 [Methylobacterium sp. BE186]|nr:hypothetical protein [Methylobacterium sp. BE186]MDR7040376.1 hypothetical protein [Methylobacterium sp. BE186]
MAGYIISGPERLREPMQRVTNRLKELVGLCELAENIARLRATSQA